MAAIFFISRKSSMADVGLEDVQGLGRQDGPELVLHVVALASGQGGR